MKYKNRTIKIFNTPYKILYVDDIETENPDRTTMGETDFNLKTIRIRVLDREGHPVSRQEMELCLLHELFHAILAEGQYLSSTSDEPLVEWLARCTKHLLDQKVLDIEQVKDIKEK